MDLGAVARGARVRHFERLLPLSLSHFERARARLARSCAFCLRPASRLLPASRDRVAVLLLSGGLLYDDKAVADERASPGRRSRPGFFRGGEPRAAPVEASTAITRVASSRAGLPSWPGQRRDRRRERAVPASERTSRCRVQRRSRVARTPSRLRSAPVRQGSPAPGRGPHSTAEKASELVGDPSPFPDRRIRLVAFDDERVVRRDRFHR